MNRTRRFLLFVTAVFLFSGCGIGGLRFQLKNPKKPGKYPRLDEETRLFGGLTNHRTCFDVKKYSLDIKIDAEKKYIQGTVGIHALAVMDTDTLQLDLYRNMKLNEVRVNGNEAVFSRKENAVFLVMPRRIPAGERFFIFLNYEGSPQPAKKPPWDGGFVWKTDKNGKTWAGMACESEGASLWWPNKDHNSDEADSTAISLTVKAQLVAVSNGVLQDSIYNASDSTITYKWLVSYPINNYNITFYLGDYRLIRDSFNSITGNEVMISHYVLPYNFEKAKTHFQQAKDHLAFFEKTYGPYPWQRDGYRLVESPYAGMEHQSAIAYGNGYKNDHRQFDYIILHETAHEWWGNSVTAFDLADAWLHEGFATYSEALYLNETKSYGEYLRHLYFYRLAIRNKFPVVRERGRRFFDYRDQDIYTKGAWVLHTLRSVINNDSVFFDILKTFYVQNTMKEIYSEAFIDLVNQKTGEDYTWFFKQYLFNRRIPFLEYQLVPEGLLCRWTDVNDDFKMPYDILINDELVRIAPSSKVLLFRVAGANIDVNTPSLRYLTGIEKNKRLKRLYKKGK